MGKPKQTLAGRMQRLGIEILPDSKVRITFVVLDGGKLAGMTHDEKMGARVARKELTSGRGIGRERRRRLARTSVPLKAQPIVYPNLRSALRAVGEHIPKSKKIEREKILGLIGEIKTVIGRINDTKGRIGVRELDAKLGRLGGIVERLERRNIVSPVDNYADLAKGIIPEATSLLEEGKWYLACPKLVAAMNVLSEKLEHDEKDVLTKNAERAGLLGEIIRLKGERSERIRRAVGSIAKLPLSRPLTQCERQHFFTVLSELANSLRNSKEEALVEVRKKLLEIRESAVYGRADEMRTKAGQLPELLKKADELAG